MAKIFLILLAAPIVFLQSSCSVLSEFPEDYFYSFLLADGSAVKLSFKKGDTLDWDTGAGRGTMKVISIDGGKFKLEQYNELNKKAGKVIITGEVFQDGSCRIYNPEWKEVWEGNLNGNSLVGKVNNIRSFKITWEIPSYLSSSIVKSSKLPFSNGDILKWNLGTTTGTMKVISLKDDNFSLEKYNDFNKKAAPVKMNGSINSNGDCRITSESGKEIWIGKLAANTITGKASNGYNFKISRSNAVWNMPFKQGGVLNWSTTLKKGTFKVVSVSSTGKFVFDVYKSNFKYLKDSRLNGEILADGTYKLIDEKYQEVWIGRRNGSEISGKINNDAKFKITGLK